MNLGLDIPQEDHTNCVTICSLELGISVSVRHYVEVRKLGMFTGRFEIYAKLTHVKMCMPD